jgi:hypothetical protein
MSDIKEVKVAISEADMKAFSRGTRRRRVKRSDDTTELIGGSAIVERVAPVAPIAPVAIAPIVASAPVVPTPAPTPAPIAPAPVIPAVPVAPAASAAVGGAVVIQAKKPTQLPQPVQPAPKILPTKKRPGITIKKPRLVIPSAEQTTPDKSTTPAKATETSKLGDSIPKKKRRFTERNISIEVKSASATRKHRRTLKRNIDSMSAASVKKFLIRKGVLKPKADGSSPPEEMMRSMLKDYVLLHTAE